MQFCSWDSVGIWDGEAKRAIQLQHLAIQFIHNVQIISLRIETFMMMMMMLLVLMLFWMEAKWNDVMECEPNVAG